MGQADRTMHSIQKPTEYFGFVESCVLHPLAALAHGSHDYFMPAGGHACTLPHMFSLLLHPVAMPG